MLFLLKISKFYYFFENLVSLNIKYTLYLKKSNLYLKQEHKNWLILAGLIFDEKLCKKIIKN